MTHRIEVEVDDDGAVECVRFTCDEPEGSLCRSWCTVCEETCSAEPILGSATLALVELVAQAPVDGHLYEPVPYCRFVEWLGAGDTQDSIDLHDEDEPLRPGTHPIEVAWDGDEYVWHYAVPDPEPAYPGHP
jgi:hypothetical protein